MSGAANICGYVPEGDYARGNVEAAKKAWKPLADSMNVSVEEAARMAMEFAAKKNRAVASQLLSDYKMDPRTTVFVGGGGGASSVVPHLAETMGHCYRLAKNSPVISTIGVALALVRDVVERTICNPTENDIMAIRREAEEHAIRAGATPESVEVTIEVDSQKNILRAIAIGNTEMRSKKLGSKKIDENEIKEIVAENMQIPVQDLFIKASNGQMHVVMQNRTKKRFFGLLKKNIHPIRLIDDEGVIRLQKSNASVRQVIGKDWENIFSNMLEDNADYGDGGEQLPNSYVVWGKRIINLCGLSSIENILSIARFELASLREDDILIFICSNRMD